MASDRLYDSESKLRCLSKLRCFSKKGMYVQIYLNYFSITCRNV